ncbi:MAG: hypothetical protein DSZ33_02240, partial [Gammaproteobacteria bacterium]
MTGNKGGNAMYEKICALCVFLLLTPASALADLTGKWDADDGGAYYLRQIGNQLHWYGERFPTHTRWSNVFHGDINGNRIDGRWVATDGMYRLYFHVATSQRVGGPTFYQALDMAGAAAEAEGWKLQFSDDFNRTELGEN